MSISTGCQLKRKAHMSGLHRDKRGMNNFSIIWKIREDSANKMEAKRARKPGGCPRDRGGRLGTKPIRGDLVDPASTVFEDEK
jgi:hypothetical protein